MFVSGDPSPGTKVQVFSALSNASDGYTSIGTGDTSIPNRLKRGEVADIVIVADGVLRQFIADGLVLAEGATTIARSMMGFAVRAGAPGPPGPPGGARGQPSLRERL